jgi:hypothetical protein
MYTGLGPEAKMEIPAKYPAETEISSLASQAQGALFSLRS